MPFVKKHADKADFEFKAIIQALGHGINNSNSNRTVSDLDPGMNDLVRLTVRKIRYFLIDKPLLAGNPSRRSGSGEPAEAGQGSGVTDKAHPPSASLLFHASVCCARLCIGNVLISPTDTELLNNQGSSLDKC